jgi:hypothetical protein
MGVTLDRTPRSSFARLARWWSTATSGERFEALKASIRGDSEAPPLKTLHLAIIAAELEAEAARERFSCCPASHGAAKGDA